MHLSYLLERSNVEWHLEGLLVIAQLSSLSLLGLGLCCILVRRIQKMDDHGSLKVVPQTNRDLVEQMERTGDGNKLR